MSNAISCRYKHGGLRLQTRQNDYEKSVFRELHSSLRTSVLVSKEVAVTTVEMKINRLISLGQQSSPSALLDRLILWVNPARAIPWLTSPAFSDIISKLSSPWPTSKQNPKLVSGKFQNHYETTKLHVKRIVIARTCSLGSNLGM